MRMQHIRKYKLLSGVAICAMAINSMAPITAAAQAVAETDTAAAPSGANDGNTTTPIKHVIVIIGENRTFDHLFATYQPVNKNETVLNLLSQGIVNADGTPGKNFAKGQQHQVTSSSGKFFLSPLTKSAYTFLPVPTIASWSRTGPSRATASSPDRTSPHSHLCSSCATPRWTSMTAALSRSRPAARQARQPAHHPRSRRSTAQASIWRRGSSTATSTWEPSRA